MNTKIREMVSKDREVLYEILQKTGVFSMQALNLAMELVDIYLFNKEQEEYQVVVAEDEHENVVGFSCFGPTAGTEGTYKLHLLVVTPALQQHGIGKLLLSYTEGQMREKGARMIVIEISSQEKYAAFVKFFSDQQFKSVGRIKSYYRSGEDMLFFVKYL